MTAHKPAVGEAVEDTARGKIGRVMGYEGPYAQLRPVLGGVEWDASPDDLRVVSVAEVLSAGVAEANARSRGEKA